MYSAIGSCRNTRDEASGGQHVTRLRRVCQHNNGHRLSGNRLQGAGGGGGVAGGGVGGGGGGVGGGGVGGGGGWAGGGRAKGRWAQQQCTTTCTAHRHKVQY